MKICKVCKVQYYKHELQGYGGRAYTYYINIPAKVGTEVLAPTASGDKRAVVTEIDLPASVIDPSFADRVKTITELYVEGSEN